MNWGSVTLCRNAEWRQDVAWGLRGLSDRQVKSFFFKEILIFGFSELNDLVAL